jgi:hypothetical protein
MATPIPQSLAQPRVVSKRLIRGALGLGAAVVATLLVGDMVLDAIVTHTIGKVGQKLTGAELTMDGADLFLLSGSGAIKNVLLANPAGFAQPCAFQIGTINVGLNPASIFSDTLEITHIRVLSPEITFEGSLGTNNLAAILKNVEAAVAGNARPADADDSFSARKMFVGELHITGAKLTVVSPLFGGARQTLDLPDIHLSGLGAGTNGITSAELAQVVLSRLNQESFAALAESLSTAGSQQPPPPPVPLPFQLPGTGDLLEKK